METFNMSKEELEVFFNKYNISELEAFKVIMQYVYDYEKEEIEKILNSVKNNKEQKLFLYFLFHMSVANDRLSFL